MMSAQRFLLFLSAVMLLWPSFGSAQSAPPGFANNEDIPWFREHPDRDKYLLILTGAAATPDVRERFRQWSVALYDIFVQEYGYEDDHVYLLLDDGENVDQAGARVDASSRLDDMYASFEALQARMNDGDQLSIVLIGHGSSRFGEAKFNNVGPDITGEEFAAILDGFQDNDLVIFNTTSASFEFARALSAEGRIVVSATRSGAERYDPVFTRFLIEGLQGRTADLDRNGRLSVLELFDYTRRNVASWYENQDRLATEHAVLDDRGDGQFLREFGPMQASGLLAEIAYLDVPAEEERDASPEARALRADMQELERAVILLRARKDNYLEHDYWTRLEALLVELARTTRRYHALP